MKYLLLFCLISSTASAQSLAGRRLMDERYGFRDVRFEMDTTAIAGLKRSSTFGVETYYTRPSDKLTVGAATLSGIYYVFIAGKLAEIKLATTGSENTKFVHEAFVGEYGPGRINTGYSDWFWGSGKENILYSFKRGSEDGSFRIISKSMQKVKAQAEKSAGKKAASDL